MEDHGIINSEGEDSQMEDLQMPVATEESSKTLLNSGIAANIKKTQNQ